MIWRACERFSVLPPGVKEDFDSNSSWSCARLLAYEQIRQMEDVPDLTGLFPKVKK